MPIEEPLKCFANEAEFTDRFLVPLLRRLGFFEVCHYHGSREFGKDLVFGDFDRFSQVTYHGLQAKFLPSIGQSESNALVDDCKEAFNNPFRHPNTGANTRIQTFTVANAGGIADNARENFVNTLATPFGGNIRMLDGKALLNLDRSAAIRQNELVGECLAGLRLELRYNNALIESSLRDPLARSATAFGTPIPLGRLRLVAVAGYLAHPVLSDRIDITAINEYWHGCANIVNAGLDHLSRFAAASTSTSETRALANAVCSMMDRVLLIGRTTDKVIDTIFSQLGPIVSV